MDFNKLTLKSQEAVAAAQELARRMGNPELYPEHLTLALLVVPRDQLLAKINEVRGGQRVTSQDPEETYQALQKFGRDLTEAAEQGKLDPVIGRDDEIRRVIQVLSRRTKNNPVLIGEPGVGKTAIAEGLALRIINGDVPDSLEDKKLMALDMGATTLDEYQKHVEKDAALARRFQPVFINEPTVEDTISILRGIKEKYELHHGVRITDSALVAAATLSNRYITDRFLPDKAIDLVDEASSRLRMQVDSKPEELDNVDREIVRLKIEQEALKKETDAASKDRLARLEKELADLEEQSAAITARWKAEKDKLGTAAGLKKKLDEARNELAAAQRQGQYQRAGELAYGVIPGLEKQLA